jgi:hypothetical protein
MNVPLFWNIQFIVFYKSTLKYSTFGLIYSYNKVTIKWILKSWIRTLCSTKMSFNYCCVTVVPYSALSLIWNILSFLSIWAVKCSLWYYMSQIGFRKTKEYFIWFVFLRLFSMFWFKTFLFFWSLFWLIGNFSVMFLVIFYCLNSYFGIISLDLYFYSFSILFHMPFSIFQVEFSEVFVWTLKAWSGIYKNSWAFWLFHWLIENFDGLFFTSLFYQPFFGVVRVSISSLAGLLRDILFLCGLFWLIFSWYIILYVFSIIYHVFFHIPSGL